LDQAYRERLLNTYFLLSQAALDDGAQVLLWPESSFPGFFNEGAIESAQLKALPSAQGADAIGSTLVAEGGYYNSALWVDPAGTRKRKGSGTWCPSASTCLPAGRAHLARPWRAWASARSSPIAVALSSIWRA